MVYYGWPKVRDSKKNAADFEGKGFKPGPGNYALA
jgi:hypothetical protein